MPAVFVDRGRHTFLEFRDTGKVKHFVTMTNGVIEIIQLSVNEVKSNGLKPHNSTPEHFARVYLSSYLEISRSARAILNGIIGHSEAHSPEPAATSFSGGSVSLEQICEGLKLDPSRCRKYLRKLVEKPGGRWAWSPEEAEKISSLLKECFNSEPQ